MTSFIQAFSFGIFILQFGDHLPRNITKAVKMLEEIAGKGSAVGQQVVKWQYNNSSYIIVRQIKSLVSDRQIDRKIDRQIDRQIDKQIDR